MGQTETAASVICWQVQLDWLAGRNNRIEYQVANNLHRHSLPPGKLLLFLLLLPFPHSVIRQSGLCLAGYWTVSPKKKPQRTEIMCRLSGMKVDSILRVKQQSGERLCKDVSCNSFLYSRWVINSRHFNTAIPSVVTAASLGHRFLPSLLPVINVIFYPPLLQASSARSLALRAIFYSTEPHRRHRVQTEKRRAFGNERKKIKWLTNFFSSKYLLVCGLMLFPNRAQNCN